MFSDGELLIDGVTVTYDIKHYQEPSIYGIDEGRISKMVLEIDGEAVAVYDRDWDVYPTNEIAKKALSILLERFG